MPANGNVSQSSVSLDTMLPLQERLNGGQINRLTALKRSCTDEPAPISSLRLMSSMTIQIEEDPD